MCTHRSNNTNKQYVTSDNTKDGTKDDKSKSFNLDSNPSYDKTDDNTNTKDDPVSPFWGIEINKAQENGRCDNSSTDSTNDEDSVLEHVKSSEANESSKENEDNCECKWVFVEEVSELAEICVGTTFLNKISKYFIRKIYC